MTTQISPSLLTRDNIPIFQMKHQPGTFLVTFPKAYHAGFSYGFNVGEAVNFATYDWLSSGSEADERYRTFARNSVFSHQRLLFTLLNHKADIAPQYHAKYVL
jgi:JmjC domain, hydroxylase